MTGPLLLCCGAVLAWYVMGELAEHIGDELERRDWITRPTWKTYAGGRARGWLSLPGVLLGWIRKR